MLEAAIYFQQREDTIDKAVLLYHRAGNLAKAIELVFTHRRFGALENLVEELDRDTDVIMFFHDVLIYSRRTIAMPRRFTCSC